MAATRLCRECGFHFDLHSLAELQWCAAQADRKVKAAIVGLMKDAERAELEKQLAQVEDTPHG